ncbi:LptA/OstA family protein [Thermodesulfobacteriota bacterium]
MQNSREFRTEPLSGRAPLRRASRAAKVVPALVMSLCLLMGMILGPGVSAFADPSREKGTAIAGAGRWCDEPIDITSDRMVANYKSREIAFEGNVRVTHCDFSLKSDSIQSNYSDDGNTINRIVATGNVRIDQGERLATAGEAEYDREEGRIILRDEPELVEGVNRIRGDLILLYLFEDRVEVRGGVNAVLKPEEFEDR